MRHRGISLKLAKCIVAFLDMMILLFAGFCSLWIRFDFQAQSIPSNYKMAFIKFLPLQIAIYICIFALCKMYHYVWHNVGLRDVVIMAPAILGAFLISSAASILLNMRLPLSVYLVMLMMQFPLFIGMRCSVRIYSDITQELSSRNSKDEIMIIGGGTAGSTIIKELHNSDKTEGHVKCVIDDNPEKLGRFVEGVKIVGSTKEIPEMVTKYGIKQIIVALPTASERRISEILSICNKTGCHVRKVLGIYQLVNGEVSLSSIQEINVEDLLGRDPIKLNMQVVSDFIEGRVILVTGGGGSIGSELCRQIAKRKPKKLIILDIYENNAYEIQQELIRIYGKKLDLSVEIASVRDKEKIYLIFDRYHPEIVFHAAAHKHVPLMENNPEEAVKNNIFGTYHVARAADKYGTEKFVMISTDKAVNPTNFMGATKRFCEMIMQSFSNSKTEYCCVRFGNVLGSNGSVVPLFSKQIANGGPVTITDKRIIRYFMTIPEAAQLVLEAGAMAKQSQIFVLDMGEPVKILDLAENMIRLAGKTPYVDIEIKEIGLRPGEKLYEELLMASNDLVPTNNEKIFIEQQEAINREVILEDLEQLDVAVTADKTGEYFIDMLKKFVPTYIEPKKVNEMF